MFDGPGQGSALYEKGLVFRPDYEAVFTPVVDWVAGQAGVDPEKDPRRRRWFMLRAVAHGARTVPEYMRMLSQYAVPAGDIVWPALVTAQPDDQETRRLYDAITAPKVLVEFAADEGAWGHCEGRGAGPVRPTTYDWLDEVLPG
jgi:hypothetical protein